MFKNLIASIIFATAIPLICFPSVADVADTVSASSKQPQKGIKFEVGKITLAVQEYYRNKNLMFEPKPASWTGAGTFWEVTDLQLLSLNGNRAAVRSTYIKHSFTFIGDKSVRNPPHAWGYRYKITEQISQIHKFSLAKENGQWKVEAIDWQNN